MCWLLQLLVVAAVSPRRGITFRENTIWMLVEKFEILPVVVFDKLVDHLVDQLLLRLLSVELHRRLLLRLLAAELHRRLLMQLLVVVAVMLQGWLLVVVAVDLRLLVVAAVEMRHLLLLWQTLWRWRLHFGRSQTPRRGCNQLSVKLENKADCLIDVRLGVMHEGGKCKRMLRQLLLTVVQIQHSIKFSGIRYSFSLRTPFQVNLEVRVSRLTERIFDHINVLLWLRFTGILFWLLWLYSVPHPNRDASSCTFLFVDQLLDPVSCSGCYSDGVVRNELLVFQPCLPVFICDQEFFLRQLRSNEIRKRRFEELAHSSCWITCTMDVMVCQSLQ